MPSNPTVTRLKSVTNSAISTRRRMNSLLISSVESIPAHQSMNSSPISRPRAVNPNLAHLSINCIEISYWGQNENLFNWFTMDKLLYSLCYGSKQERPWLDLIGCVLMGSVRTQNGDSQLNLSTWLGHRPRRMSINRPFFDPNELFFSCIST